MRTLQRIALVLAVLALASTAWAQTAVTSNDIMRLEATADEIAKQSATIRKTDPTTAASIDKSLGDLRDDIAVLRVKLRRSGSVTQAEFSDVQTRLSILRAKAQNSAPASAPANRPAPGGEPTRPASPAPTTPRTTPPPVVARTPKPPQGLSGPEPALDRVFLNVSFGASLSTYTVTSAFTFPLYDETGSASVTRTVSGKALFDLTGGVRFNDTFGAGVSFSTRHGDSDGAFTASLPDPLFFDSPRTVTGTVPKMVHSEQWVAVLLAYFVSVSDKMDVIILAGPAVAKLKHDLASSVTVTEGATAPAVAIGLTQSARSFIGFQLGADAQYFLMQGGGALKSFGVGGFVRYSRARANLSNAVKLILGGFQVGGGVRVRF